MARLSIPEVSSRNKLASASHQIIQQLDLTLMFHFDSRVWYASLWKNADREFVVGSGLTIPSALRDLANEYDCVRETAEFVSELEMVQVPR